MEKEDFKDMRKTLRNMSKEITNYERFVREHNNARNNYEYDSTKRLMQAEFDIMKQYMEHITNCMNDIGSDCDSLAYNEFLRIEKYTID